MIRYKIKLIRGKYKNCEGYICSKPFDDGLYNVRVQTGVGWKTIRIYRNGFILGEKE